MRLHLLRIEVEKSSNTGQSTLQHTYIICRRSQTSDKKGKKLRVVYMVIFDTSHNNRQQWIDIIKNYTGETDDINTIQMALSYTLQACRHNDLNRYKWRD